MARDNTAWVRELADPASHALHDLHAVLVRGLSRVLAKKGVGADLCEDLAQEAVIRVRASLDTFRGDSQFTTWALAIATRLAFDELRHKRWSDVPFDQLSTTVFDARTEDPSPDRQLVREQVMAVLRRVIDHELTPKQRGVLVAELEGMPQAEIARQLGMERNAVYKLSHDARKRAKQELLAAGMTATDVLWGFA
ncbi:MAG: sigma-70 family RNA polymerase sigma factor [Kofleriaceae bacterium]